jgi:hypothetical protein
VLDISDEILAAICFRALAVHLGLVVWPKDSGGIGWAKLELCAKRFRKMRVEITQATAISMSGWIALSSFPCIL